MRWLGCLLALGLFGAAGVAACGNTCDSAGDCVAGEVCYLGECTPSPGIRCATNEDCGGAESIFTCIAGQCRSRTSTTP